MKKSVHTSRFEGLYREAYAFFFLILAWHHPVFWGVWIIYVFFLRYRLKWLRLLIGSGAILLAMMIITQKDAQDSIDGRCQIVHVQPSVYGQTITFRYRIKKYTMNLPKTALQPGDYIHINGTIMPYRRPTIPHAFHIQNYYLSQGIYGTVQGTWRFEKKGFHLNRLRAQWMDSVSHLASKEIIDAYLFGESIRDPSFDVYRDLDIRYLFSVSGLHLYALFWALDAVFFQIDMDKRFKWGIQIGILLLFLWTYRFAFAILRVALMKGLSFLNRTYRWRMTRLDQIQMVFILGILMNPFLLYSVGVLMLYTILNALHLLKPLYDKQRGYTKMLIMTAVIQSVLFPYRLSFSFLMLFITPVMVVLFSGPVFLLSCATIFVHDLDPLLHVVMTEMTLLIKWISSVRLGVFFPALSPLGWILFYALLMVFYLSKTVKRRINSFLMIVVLVWSPKWSHWKTAEFYFLDVGLGDSMVLLDTTCVMVIDSYQHVQSFLKSKGVSRIDFLVLTHNHQDHVKEAHDLLATFDVSYVVLSAFDVYDAYPAHVMKVKSDDIIQCGRFKMDVLGPIHFSQNVNNRSIVMQFTLHQTVYLLTGDIEASAEQDLVDKYGRKLKSDVLKIAHHGSKTSSTPLFLKWVNPKTVIISTSRNNRYGFPHQEVLDRLQVRDVQIYLTADHGTICSKHNKKKQKWLVLLPF